MGVGRHDLRDPDDPAHAQSGEMPNPARGRRLPGTTEHLDQNNSSCQFPCLALSFVSGVVGSLAVPAADAAQNWTRGDRKARFEQTAERHAGLSQFAAPFLARMKFVDEAVSSSPDVKGLWRHAGPPAVRL